MTPDIEIDEALTDPALLGAGLGDPATWSTWLVTLRAAFGLKLDPAQRQAFAAVAGDRIPPERCASYGRWRAGAAASLA
jgi:hypothetical protein